MWRRCVCILFTLPFILLPIVWYTFPTSCEDGHILYAEGHEHDTDIEEPWHCHVPRYTGCACTPGYDCLSGGMYGPTNNGALLIFLILTALFALFFCTYDNVDTIPFERNDRRRAAISTSKQNNQMKRGLYGYPVR